MKARTPVVLATLEHYGFTNLDRKDSRKPHPCFERMVRKQCKKELPILPTIEMLADIIRGDMNTVADEALSDKELVMEHISSDATGMTFYSACAQGMVMSHNVWHCRTCGECRDWRIYHCGDCNKCQNNSKLPCETVSEICLMQSVEHGGASMDVRITDGLVSDMVCDCGL